MHTYASALDLVGATVPAHLRSDAEVPVLAGAQAQGDLIVMPHDPPRTGAGRTEPPGDWQEVPADGVRLVEGEATGNTHWLHRGFDSPGVRWRRPAPSVAPDDDGLTVAHLRVPPRQSALLIHTDEHGANGIGAGEYVIRRKRQSGIRFRPPTPAYLGGFGYRPVRHDGPDSSLVQD